MDRQIWHARDRARQALYKEEYEFVSTHQFAEAMRPVFEIAGVEYGRVDFGLVGGRPQIYEINSNPDVKLRPKPSEIALRNKSNDLFRKNYLEAMREIDSFARGPRLRRRSGEICAFCSQFI